MAKLIPVDLIVKVQDMGHEKLESIGSNLAKIGAKIFAFYLFIESTASIISTMVDQDRTLNSLNQSLIRQGIYTKDLSKSYQGMAAQFEKVTTFSKSSILSAETRLQSYLKQTEISDRLIKATLDFATAKGIDLDSAAQLLGKSIGSNVNGLARYGIEIDANVPIAQKLEEAISQVEKKFGNQSIAAAQGLGALKQARNAFVGLIEVLGIQLAPLIVYLAKEFKALAIEVKNNRLVLDTFASFVHKLMASTIIVESVVQFIWKSFAKVISGPFSVGEDILKGQFNNAFKRLKTGYENASVLITDQYKDTNVRLDNLNKAFYSNRDDASRKQIEIMRQTSDQRAIDIRNGILSNEEIFEARDRKELQKLIVYDQMKGNDHLIALTQAIEREKNQTKKLELELQKRQIIQKQIEDTEYRRSIMLSELNVTYANDQLASLERVLNNLQQVQRSQYSTLVEIGKAAAIAAMTIAGIKAVQLTFKWVAMIPVVGPIAAPVMAGLVGLWYLEQISNIAGSSIDNPGKIGFGLNFGNILEYIKVILTNLPGIAKSLLSEYAKQLLKLHQDQIDNPSPTQFPDGYGGTVTEPNAPFKDFSIGVALETIGNFIKFVGDVVGKVLDWLWPFAEGGLVTTNLNRETVVTPLNKAPLFELDIRVSVLGGLNGTQLEAKNLAYLIFKEIKREKI
jgi:hypothetical protein